MIENYMTFNMKKIKAAVYNCILKIICTDLPSILTNIYNLENIETEIYASKI